jgi:hypothetical protein
MSGEKFAPEATFAKITYTGAGPRFLKTQQPEIRPASQHCGNATDAVIHHPKLGQVDTGGDRFGAILKASGRLHALQSGERFAASMRLRAMGRAPVLRLDDPEAKETERRRLEREFDRLFGIE